MVCSVRMFLLLLFCSPCLLLLPAVASPAPDVGGEMMVFDPKDNSVHIGAFPLEHTAVHATILGPIVRTTVRQSFQNSFDRPIDAKYVFPLPPDSAVDAFTMSVGDRRIVGEIHERGESRRIYERARSEGHTASLLNQERPNCFTQRIANIAPAEEVEIEIQFLESIQMAEGVFEWHFPMVVGPRYVPVEASRVDAQDLVQATLPPNVCDGHTISLTVDILGAATVSDIASELHEIDVLFSDASSARVTLARRDEIPNRDFVLRFRAATTSVQDGLFLHTDETGSYFSVLLQPPARAMPAEILPREILFVIDSSGSMHGEPLELAKATMRKCIATLGPQDTFNLLAFASETQACFDAPVATTPENLHDARAFLDSLKSHGGTEMMPAVHAALAGAHDPSRLRIVCFMTDGYIGYEYDLLSAIRENVHTARVFSFGVGNSVNRFLLEQMARVGRGDVAFVSLEGDPAAEADRFLMRIHAPLLTDIAIDWGALPVDEVTPAQIADVFTDSPILVYGRFTGSVEYATITVTGRTAEGEYRREVVAATRPEGGDFSFIRKLWARSRIWDLRMSELKSAQQRDLPDRLRSQIVELSTTHRVLSEETAFVAVQQRTMIDPATSLEVQVPVHLPEGMTATATNDRALIAVGATLLLAALALLCPWRRRHARA